MKLSYIFSLLPLVAANDGYLYEDRHHLRRALTAEGVQESCGYDSESNADAACGDVECPKGQHCVASSGCSCNNGWCDHSSCTNWCTECFGSTPSNDYEMVETGDGWEDVVDGD